MKKLLTLAITILNLDYIFSQVCVASSCTTGCCQDPSTCASSFLQCSNSCSVDVNCNGKCCINNTCQVCPTSGFMVPQALVYVLIVALAVLTIGVCTYAIYKDRKRKTNKRFRNLIAQGQVITRGPKIDTVSFPSTADTSLAVEDLEKSIAVNRMPKILPMRTRFKSQSGIVQTRNSLTFDMNSEPELLPEYTPYSADVKLPNEGIGTAQELIIPDEPEGEATRI